MKSEIQHTEFAIKQASVSTIREQGGFMDAVYQHPQGYARLYSATYSSGDASWIDFIWKGRWHTWTFNKKYTAKGLARKAFHLINEVTQL